MFCYLSSFAGFLGIPLLSLIAPLVLWLLKRKESKFIDTHGKEVVNFQITIYLAVIVLFVVSLVGIPFLAIFIVGVCYAI